jgi:hypothetical protein
MLPTCASVLHFAYKCLRARPRGGKKITVRECLWRFSISDDADAEDRSTSSALSARQLRACNDTERNTIARRLLQEAMSFAPRKAPMRSAAICIASLFLSSCATAIHGELATNPVGEVRLAHSATGTLLLEGECTRLLTSGPTYFVIWPTGSHMTFSATPPLITDAAGETRAVGSRVTLQGGEIAADSFPPGSRNRALMNACGGPFFATSGFMEP